MPDRVGGAGVLAGGGAAVERRAGRQPPVAGRARNHRVDEVRAETVAVGLDGLPPERVGPRRIVVELVVAHRNVGRQAAGGEAALPGVVVEVGHVLDAATLDGDGGVCIAVGLAGELLLEDAVEVGVLEPAGHHQVAGDGVEVRRLAGDRVEVRVNRRLPRGGGAVTRGDGRVVAVAHREGGEVPHVDVEEVGGRDEGPRLRGGGDGQAGGQDRRGEGVVVHGGDSETERASRPPAIRPADGRE